MSSRVSYERVLFRHFKNILNKIIMPRYEVLRQLKKKTAEICHVGLVTPQKKVQS